MSYFPEDIPFMSKEELRENGIRIPKDVPDTNVGSKNLIDRQQAIDALECQIEQCNKALSNFGISMIDEYAVKVERASLVVYKERLECLPSAQTERPKGRWIPQNHNKVNGMVSTAVYYYPKCSVCGHCANYTNFCPNCGADMRNNKNVR